MPFDVPFIRPLFPSAAEISEDFEAIAESNWYTNFGPVERRFSAAIAASVGEGYHAVTFANATIALIGLLQAVVGRGDGTRSILVPSFTFAAGPGAIEWAGYKPLLVDVELSSLQPAITDARAAIEDSAHDVAAILLCNAFGMGNPAIAEWEALAADSGLPLLIDSAAGFGSSYADGSPVGSAGVAEVFSFHATKPFAVGEGGAVLTRDKDLADRLHSFQNFGFAGELGATWLGVNGKLQEINAAIGLRQLARFADVISSRQAVATAYSDALSPFGIAFPPGLLASSVCFATALFPDVESRDTALDNLARANVEVRAYYHPAVHRQPHFSGAARVGALSNTDTVVGRVVSLPVHTYMSDAARELVIDAIVKGLE